MSDQSRNRITSSKVEPSTIRYKRIILHSNSQFLLINWMISQCTEIYLPSRLVLPSDFLVLSNDNEILNTGDN